MAGQRYRAKKKPIAIKVPMKIVRVDDKTQIEVPIHLSDAVAIERFLQRKKIGPRIIVTPPPVTGEDELEIPPEELNELIAEETEPKEEGDE